MVQHDEAAAATHTTATRPRRPWLRLLAGGLVTAILLGLLFFLTDWESLLTQVRALHWAPVATAALLQWTVYLIRATRFSLLTPRLRFREMTVIAALHILALRLFPLRTGELVYPLLLRRSGEATLPSGLLGLAMLRLLDGLVILACFAGALLLTQGLHGNGAWQNVAALAALVIVGVAVVLVFPRLIHLSLRVLRWLANLTHLLRRHLVARLLLQLENGLQAHRQTSARTLGRLAALTIVHWLVNYAVIASILIALEIHIPLLKVALGGTAAVVSTFVPIGGIGTFGPLETGWMIGFVAVGLSRVQAVASSLVYSAVTFSCAIVFAALTLLYSRKFAGHLWHNTTPAVLDRADEPSGNDTETTRVPETDLDCPRS